MNYKVIRDCIVKGLHDHLQRPVVPTDNNKKKPDYPFVSYKFTTPYRKQGGNRLIKTPVPSQNPKFAEDIEITFQEQHQMIISLSSYSLDEVEAYELALKVKDWFCFHGYDFLKANNIITVETSTIQDRTILIVDNYEKRSGLDITLRTVNEQKKRIETIETMKMEGSI